MIQLAYTISRQDTTGRRDFNSAYFCWIAYEATTESHDEVLAAVRENKNIVRYIDLTTTKEAARHSVEIREFTAATKGKEEDAEEAEAVADAELDAALQSATI
jgi:ribosomal protein S6